MPEAKTARRVAVVGGNRIPFARSNGPYATASNSDMLSAALDGLVERYDLQGKKLGEVAAGAVLKHARDFSMTREVVLGSRLDRATPAVDITQACSPVNASNCAAPASWRWRTVITAKRWVRCRWATSRCTAACMPRC